MIAKGVPGNVYKSTLDCVDGYHGIALAKEDRHKTTFATQWGKFRYTRPCGARVTQAPQGYLSSGDRYSKYTDAILENCPSTSDVKDFEKIVDNVITWSTSITGAFNRICSILVHCNKNGLVFNTAKF